MSQLPNPRHELFSALLAEGKNAAEAHELAGYRRNRHNAWVLTQRENIKARVNELLAERQAQNAQATAKAVEELALTQEWVLAELKRNAEQAAKLKQYGPSNRALELLGKQLGMFIDRAQISQSNEFAGLTAEQMLEELVRRARKLGIDRELLRAMDHDEDGDGRRVN